MQLIHGDCVEKMKEMEESCIDLTVTSPPYDDLRTYKGFTWDFEATAHQLFRITKPGGIVVWIVGDETKDFCESLTSFKQAIFFVDVVGFNLLDTMIYYKNGGPSPYPGLKRYAPWFEYMFVFSKGKPKTFNPLKDRRNKGAAGKINSGNTARQRDGKTIPTGSYVTPEFSTRTNVWTYDVGRNKDTKDVIAFSHPARFPENLAKDHILSWSNVGDIVFDPFMGSGTTGKMAILNDRNFIGIDISEEYVNVSRKRIEQAVLAAECITPSNS